MRTPSDLKLFDGSAECLPEEYDDMGGGSYGVQINAFIYDSKDIKKLKRWLEKAERWIVRKETLTT
jgi:hypothetical protein